MNRCYFTLGQRFTFQQNNIANLKSQADWNRFCLRILLYSATSIWSESRLSATVFYLRFLWMKLSYWLIRDWIYSMHLRAAECDVAGMRVSLSKSVTMVLDRQKWLVTFRLEESSYLKWRSLSILGSCLQAIEWWTLRLKDRSALQLQVLCTNL